ncbi:MAG TPA: acyltransferase family protein [Candidatus Mediterraneibacter norfolkensis]|nr:acyltransferase family protein [Candidatus Mediterraneibacter norfolkensis]
MVVLVHVSTQKWYIADPNTIQWKIYNMYDSSVRSSVSLFIMLSGALFLNKKELSIKKLFKKNIWKLLVIYCVWALLYGIDSLGAAESIKPGNLFSLFQQIVYPKYHLWYLPSLIGIYFLIPLFWALAQFKEKKYLEYGCIMFVLFGILRSTFSAIFESHETINAILNLIPYELCGLSGYFILGYTLVKYKGLFTKIKLRYLLPVLLAAIIITAKVEEYKAVNFGDLRGVYYANSALPTFLEAIIIFGIFLKIPSKIENRRISDIVTKISRKTLFIYLVHVFILEHLESWFGISAAMFNAWISVPVISIIVFIISIFLAGVVEKIPVAGKWMM